MFSHKPSPVHLLSVIRDALKKSGRIKTDMWSKMSEKISEKKKNPFDDPAPETQHIRKGNRIADEPFFTSGGKAAGQVEKRWDDCPPGLPEKGLVENQRIACRRLRRPIEQTKEHRVRFESRLFRFPQNDSHVTFETSKSGFGAKRLFCRGKSCYNTAMKTGEKGRDADGRCVERDPDEPAPDHLPDHGGGAAGCGGIRARLRAARHFGHRAAGDRHCAHLEHLRAGGGAGGDADCPGAGGHIHIHFREVRRHGQAEQIRADLKRGDPARGARGSRGPHGQGRRHRYRAEPRGHRRVRRRAAERGQRRQLPGKRR